MLITEYIHVETGAGEPARICASNLRRMSAAQYGALEQPADDTLYLIIPEDGAEDRSVEGIYQGGNAVYRKGFSGFELEYIPLEGEAFAASDSEAFVTADDRDLFAAAEQAQQ